MRNNLILISFGAFLALAFFCREAKAATYYVDYTNGNDNNAGTQDLPLKNHPWMSTFSGAISLSAGDTVYMKRGETWSVSNPTADFVTIAASGTAGSYITTTAYGSGERPLIKIATNTAKNVVYGAGKSFIKFDNLHIEHWSASDYGPNTKDGIQFRKDGQGNVPHDRLS